MAESESQVFAPVLRVAPLGELKIFVITESELDELERGSPAAIQLNLALFFWGVAASTLAVLVTASLSDRAFVVFTVFFVTTLIAAIALTVLWMVKHLASRSLADRIRSRMPPPPAVQEFAPPG